MFKTGDIIVGTRENGYSYTNEHALMLVGDVKSNGDMYVHILYHVHQGRIGDVWPVTNSENRFRHITFAEYLERYPDCDKLSNSRLDELFEKYTPSDRPITLKVEKEIVPYVLSEEMRKELIDEMKELLITYRYHPTEDALNKILDEWCANKADLIRMFEKHPNYNGKFQIAFDHDFDREFDKATIANFRSWLDSSEVRDMYHKPVKIGAFEYNELYNITRRLNAMMDVFDTSGVNTVNGKTFNDYYKEYIRFDKMKDKYEFTDDVIIVRRHAYDKKIFQCIRRIENMVYLLNQDYYLEQFVTSEAEQFFNQYFNECKIKSGQKLSRAINKVLTMLEVNKSPDYNKEFAKLADALNPLKIKRHTVLSVHPVDYLTMSFGNSWSSCHTIDKRNDRGVDSEHNYRGCNSSGTISYMLDETSCVFYTVDASYDGNKLELQDKINRCMFHYNDKRLLQARVYPQSNDNGAMNLYRDIREIVQKIFADLLEVPNLWTNRKGIDACEDASSSKGTHYKDYLNFSNCNVSTLKDDRAFHSIIRIGHNPICVQCGEEHGRENNVECDYCAD